MSLFSHIELACRQIGSNVYPDIIIHDLIPISPALISADPVAGRGDFFILEKYTIDRSNQTQMQAMADAVFYQSVLYYMSDNTYMSSYLFMGGYDLLTEPETIDITSLFVAGKTHIVDPDADLTNNMYVYRVLYYYNDEEFASDYVAGIQHINFTRESSLDMTDTASGVTKLVTSSDTLFRESTDGNIIVKGLQIPVFNARYRGPLDGHKEVAKQQGLVAITASLGSMLDEIESKILSCQQDITDIAKDIVTEIRN